jgi:NADH dehydrogenase FAD-containing subunit
MEVVPKAFRGYSVGYIFATRPRTRRRNTPNAKNVVVLGGSFAGIELVNRLVETLPTGYKAVWIEKNSHLNYSFNFPRFSVLPGHEQTAFIPYDGIARGAPTGIFSRVQDRVIGLTENQVLLASGIRSTMRTSQSRPSPHSLCPRR